VTRKGRGDDFGSEGRICHVQPGGHRRAERPGPLDAGAFFAHKEWRAHFDKRAGAEALA
jgi:hypothetical protein